jgi:Trypsin
MIRLGVALMGLLLITFSCSTRIKAKLPEAPISIQQKSTHLIRFVSVSESGDREDDGVCTATAVGPHVVLTAEHCFDEKKDKVVLLDLSTKEHIVLASTKDGRDHVMIGISGAPFQNYVDLGEVTGKSVSWQHVYMYGCGEGNYPPRLLTGQQVPGFDSASEIDQADDVQKFILPVVPGDSGSAIWSDDGKLVAIVTYGHSGSKEHAAVGFGLNFSPMQIAVALNEGAGETI